MRGRNVCSKVSKHAFFLNSAGLLCPVLAGQLAEYQKTSFVDWSVLFRRINTCQSNGEAAPAPDYIAMQGDRAIEFERIVIRL